MKKYVTNARVWVLYILATIALVLLLSEPNADELKKWLLVMITTKAASVVLFVLCVRLFKHWAREGKIDCLTDLIKEEE